MIKKPTSETKVDINDTFILPNLCEYQSLLILIIVTQLLIIALMLFRFGLDFDWTNFGMLTLYVQWQAICSAVVLCKSRYFLNRLTKYQAFAMAYGMLLMVSFLLSVVVEWHISKINFSASLGGEFIIRNVLLSAIIIGISLRYLYVQQQSLNREKSMLSANLSALQARIKPHFLFNTMNSIASLITIAPEKAEKMVEDLSELLRASLRDDVVETTIAEEWQLCERYLAIEQLRLGQRLSWSCDFSHLNQELMIPHLSLQPIIENAIYHGIQPNPKEGFLKVFGESLGNNIHISVENSQLEAQQKLEFIERGNRGNKMAVQNIRYRIHQLYGNSAALELLDKGSTYLVSLRYQTPEPDAE